MKHILKITPVVNVALRHAIEDLLKEKGYHIIGGGQSVLENVSIKDSFSDISFESLNNKKQG